MSEELIIVNTKYRFKWSWCESCEVWTIVCPKCGNNCCNGGYGTLENGEDCDICSLAHSYEDLAYATDVHPKWKPNEDTKRPITEYIVI